MDDWRPKLTAIEDPIATDEWSYRTECGSSRTSRVIIGQPALLADGTNWYCPMYFEHITQGVECAFGVGPVDALMNAMSFVRTRFQEFDGVIPQAGAAAGSERPRTKKSRTSKKMPQRD